MTKPEIELRLKEDKALIARSAANRAKTYAEAARFREGMARHHARTAEMYAYVSAVCTIVAIIVVLVAR